MAKTNLTEKEEIRVKKQKLNFLYCPKCNQKLILIRKEAAQSEGVDVLLNCIKCESCFGFVLKDLSKSEHFWNIYNHSTIGLYLTKREKAYVDQAFRRNKFIRSVLDIGCGVGRFSIPIHEKGFSVVALEFDKTPLLILRNKKPAIPIILADGAKLPFKKGSFDCIMCIQGLEYIDRISFFEECGRVLKDEGLLLFQSDNKYSYKRIVRRLTPWGNYYPLPFPRPSDLKKELHPAGFNIEKIRGYNWIPVTRWSNSKFVHFFALLERLLKLEAVPLISPWLFVTARKTGK